MKIEFTKTDTVNGYYAADRYKDYAVTIDGEHWGWVVGPDRNTIQQRGAIWMALREGADYWTGYYRNREAAVLAAL